MTLVIKTAPTIPVEIDDVRIEFIGDPDPEAFQRLFTAFREFSESKADDGFGSVILVRDRLRDALVPASRETWDALIADGKLGLAVLVQLLEGVVAKYADSVGFRSGLPRNSPSGQPETGPTSPGTSPAPAS